MLIHLCLPCGSGTIDLADLARSTGKKVKDKYTGEVSTSVRAGQCRKLLKLVIRYGTYYDLQKADEYLRSCGNKKVTEIWEHEYKGAWF